MLYQKKIMPRTSDFDTFDKIKMHSLLDMFQDLAKEHADILGLGYNEFKPKNLMWILLSTKIEIIKDVTYGEEVVLKTWPHPKGRIDFIRDYQVLSPEGDVYVKASSKWIVVDFVTRKIKRTSDIDYPEKTIDDKNFDDVSRIRIDIPEDKEFVCDYKVVNNDLDHNGHMNNCKYMELVYNTMDIKNKKHLVSLHIDFINEVMLGQTISLYKFNLEEEQYYVGYVDNIQSFIAKVKENEHE